MEINPQLKIAFLSHVVPPAPSGQSVILYRLLRDLPGDQYILISHKNLFNRSSGNPAANKLAGKYYLISNLFQLPQLSQFKISMLTDMFNIPWGIYHLELKLLKILKVEKPDLLITCSGDLYDLPAGFFACKRLSIPFVPYLFDDYIYQWTGSRRYAARILEPMIMRGAASIIFPNEFIQNEYRRRYNVGGDLIRNACDPGEFKNPERTQSYFNVTETNIVYTGAVYHAQYDSFRNLISAIDLLKRPDLKLHIFTGQTEQELIANHISGRSVAYHRHVHNDEIPMVLAQADVLFLPLAFKSPIPEVIKTSAPGKIGEYLAAGRPILVNAPPDSFVSYFFKKNDCGLVADKDDPAVLSEMLNILFSDKLLQKRISVNAAAVAQKEFDIVDAGKQLIQLINRTASA